MACLRCAVITSSLTAPQRSPKGRGRAFQLCFAPAEANGVCKTTAFPNRVWERGPERMAHIRCATSKSLLWEKFCGVMGKWFNEHGCCSAKRRHRRRCVCYNALECG